MDLVKVPWGEEHSEILDPPIGGGFKRGSARQAGRAARVPPRGSGCRGQAIAAEHTYTGDLLHLQMANHPVF
ncbi:unnamed protein product [marine sediment metagenome]|uniref:Uncharacterized protein n=1 Tax=marine sediment metagenome TaxID=412755 RepID=X0TF97_9ZZZZ